MEPTAEDVQNSTDSSKAPDSSKDGSRHVVYSAAEHAFDATVAASRAVGDAVTGAAQNVSDAARPLVVNKYTEPVIEQYNNLLSPVVVGEGDDFGEDVQGKEEVILRIEISASAEVKAMRTCTYVIVVFAIAFTIALVAMKFKLDPSLVLRNSDDYFVVSVAVSAVFLAILLIVAVVFIRRIINAWKNGLVWSKRRATIAGAAFFVLMLQICNLSCMIAVSAYSIAKKCGWQSYLAYSLGYVQWTLWNFTLLTLVCLAHNGSIWKGKTKSKKLKKNDKKINSTTTTTTTAAAAAIDEEKEPEPELQQPVTALVMDAPMRVHLPKLFFWGLLQAMLTISLVKFSVNGYGTTCLGSGDLICPPLSNFAIIGLIIRIFVIWGYFATYCYFAWRTSTDLKLRPYTEMRMARMVFGIQHEQVAPVVATFSLCSTLLLSIEPQSCWTFVQTWMGVVPLQAMGTMMAGSLCFYFMPKKPGSAEEVLQTWLQEYAWSEKQVPKAMQRRNAKLAGSSTLAEKPMFCIETAIKMLYYAKFAYNVTEKSVVDGGDNSGGIADAVAKEEEAAAKVQDQKQNAKTNEAIADLELGEDAPKGQVFGNVAFAKSMYNLTNAEIFYEESTDTKAIMLWGNNTLVVAFKGTSSFENALTDINILKTIHPPQRTAPMSAFWGLKLLPALVRVHKGFLAAWTGNGFDQRVLAKVNQIVNEEFSYPDPESNTSATNGSSPVTIYVTGHSLGGALATLAAHAIKTAHPNTRMTVYTFGSPRVGNKPFAYEYNNLISTHFGCISGQDPVSRQPKGWYKRVGDRVLIDNLGNIIVRPTYLEMHLINRMTPKVIDHMIPTYRLSFMRAIKMQVASWKGEEGEEARELAREIDLNKALLGVNLTEADLVDSKSVPMTLEQVYKNMEISRKELGSKRMQSKKLSKGA